jgi:transposase-like protein
MSILSKKHFHDEAAAFAYLEATLWPNGPTCPHCGNADASRITRLEGKAHRIGVHKCNECRQQFTVKVGTVFEHGRIPLHKFLQAVYLMSASKKGVSAHQLHRILEVTYKTAWFLAHRIREAMRDGKLAPPMMGGPGKVVEVDETLQGKQDGHAQAKGAYHMNVVLTLVERGGESRTFHVDGTTVATLMPILRANIHKETVVMTDEASWYQQLGGYFFSHDTVNHRQKEYVRGDITTNTVEGFFSIFKRGMKGVYQHCSEKHLHRYVAEFNFRYSNRVALGVDDQGRADRALKGIVGKRLTYRA